MFGKKVRVRMAPSPTGPLHIGTVRTALFNYLIAKKYEGVFVLRIDDTDKLRSKKEYEIELLDGLKALRLDYDEGPEVGGVRGPYRQSERMKLYRAYLEVLLETGQAYVSDEASAPTVTAEVIEKKQLTDTMNERRESVIRFKVPKLVLKFNDLIRSEIEVDMREEQDFVIAKDLDTPLYNFCSVVDDVDMEITHIIRGEDHISNTPKQILLFDALGAVPPKFGHLPLILNSDRSKLSKRQGNVSFFSYLAEGYLPEALINFLVLLGWNPKSTQELFSLSELEGAFDIKKINKAGAVFDVERLRWFNKKYIQNMTVADLTRAVIPYLEKANYIFMKDDDVVGLRATGEDLDMNLLEKDVALLQDRLVVLSDAPEYMKFFFVDVLEYDKALLAWKEQSEKDVLASLEAVFGYLEGLQEDQFSEDEIKNDLLTLAKDLGVSNGELLWPVRVAMTGEKQSPGTFELLTCFGREESLKRIKVAIDKLR